MDVALAQTEPLYRLADVMRHRRGWSVDECLAIAAELAAQVQQLHASGRTHRAIAPEEVFVDRRLRPWLNPPPETRRLGGKWSDPDSCPPEIANRVAVELPDSIVAADASLRGAGVTMDPRRVDVYQLGVLLWRLLRGTSILDYLYSPTAKSGIPGEIAALLDRALGHDPANRLTNVEAFAAELHGALRQLGGVVPEAANVETTTEPAATTAFAATASGGPPVGEGRPAVAAPDVPTSAQLGPYQLVSWIGGGGMGDVYKAYDPALDRFVAVKVLRPELARQPVYVQRFRREAAAAGGITHPNVVPVHWIGEDDGRHFFAMRYIEGESLARRLARAGRLPADVAVRIVADCLAGLQAAHAAGLIHRDLKPANILLEAASGRAVLVDFGLARQLDSVQTLTAPGTILGTADYMAPELASGMPADARADIYSLGVVAYELVSGQLPFVASSATSMLFQHVHEEPLPLRAEVAGIPPHLCDVVARMLAKDPRRRYPDCASALADWTACSARPAPPASLAWDSAPDAMPRGGEGASALPRWWRRATDWAALRLRAFAPELVARVQSTTRFVDGAVERYERRHAQLTAMHREACEILAELRRQLPARAESAGEPVATDLACTLGGSALADLRAQIDQQQEMVDRLSLDMAKATATLARVRSQRDILHARRRMAEAQLRKPGIDRRLPLRRALMVCGGGLLLCIASCWLVWRCAAWRSAATDARESASSAGSPPAAALFEKDALTLLSFEADTFTEWKGRVLIEDLSGRANHWTMDQPANLVPGRAGKALRASGGAGRLPRALLNGRSDFTVTAWLRLSQAGVLFPLYTEETDEDSAGAATLFRIGVAPEAYLDVYAWNGRLPSRWMRARTPPGSFPIGAWVFVAVRLEHGKPGSGILTIWIDDQTYLFVLQSFEHERAAAARLGPGDGEIDEVGVFDRAMSDNDIRAVRARATASPRAAE